MQRLRLLSYIGRMALVEEAPRLDFFAVLRSLSSEISAGRGYVDTHCHLKSTLDFYESNRKEPSPSFEDIPAFTNHLFPEDVTSVVDIFCEPPYDDLAEKLANSDKWRDGFQYYFAAGCHPHNAKNYTDEHEARLIELMQHPKAKAWGECGLDYHYDLSPRELQQQVLIRQLKAAIKIGKPLVIHTREADDDMLRILTTHVPQDYKIHVHCFTDTLELAVALANYFPNLFIGVTGVATYSSNLNTKQVVAALDLKRLLLETDSPYMTPSPVHSAIKDAVKKLAAEGGKQKSSSAKVRTCHSGMIPWTAQWIADVKGLSIGEVLEQTSINARTMYL